MQENVLTQMSPAVIQQASRIFLEWYFVQKSACLSPQEPLRPGTTIVGSTPRVCALCPTPNIGA